MHQSSISKLCCHCTHANTPRKHAQAQHAVYSRCLHARSNHAQSARSSKIDSLASRLHYHFRASTSEISNERMLAHAFST